MRVRYFNLYELSLGRFKNFKFYKNCKLFDQTANPQSKITLFFDCIGLYTCDVISISVSSLYLLHHMDSKQISCYTENLIKFVFKFSRATLKQIQILKIQSLLTAMEYFQYKMRVQGVHVLAI